MAGAKGDIIRVDRDEHPRDGVTAESLGKLSPVFKKGGTVTAGNASGITDGAAAVVLASEQVARRVGRDTAGMDSRLRAIGVEPRRMGIGPVPAVRALLERNDFDWATST